MKKVINWLSQVKNVVTTIISVITLTTLVIGGVKGYNKWLINKNNEKVQKEEYRAIQDSILYAIQGMQNGQLELYYMVGDLGNRMRSQEKKIDKLQGLVLKNATKEEIIQYFEVELKKNNDSCIVETPFVPDKLLIPYSLTSLLHQ